MFVQTDSNRKKWSTKGCPFVSENVNRLIWTFWRQNGKCPWFVLLRVCGLVQLFAAALELRASSLQQEPSTYSITVLRLIVSNFCTYNEIQERTVQYLVFYLFVFLSLI